MRTLEDEVKEAWANTTRTLCCKVEIDGEEVQQDDITKMSITEGIDEEDDFETGGAVSGTIELVLNNFNNNYDDVTFAGKTLVAWIGIDPNNEIDYSTGLPANPVYTKLGTYLIEDADGDSSFTIEGYDFMVCLEVDYEEDNSTLTFPCTVKDVFNEVVELAGIETDITDFPNSDTPVSEFPSDCTYRDIVQGVGQVAGGFIKFNEEGILTLIGLTETDLVINKDNYTSMSMSESYELDSYACEESIFQVESYDFNITITPFEATWLGSPAYTPGDIITIDKGTGEKQTIITSNTITWNGGVRYKSECTGLNSTESSTQQIGNQTKTNAKYSSSIEQLNYQITMCVTYDSIGTTVTQNAESWGLSINGELKGTQYIFDGDSAKFYGGGLEIYSGESEDSPGNKVFYADTSGNLTMNGSFVQYDSNTDMKSIQISKNMLIFYDYTDDLGTGEDNPVGYITSINSNNTTHIGMGVYCDVGDYLAIGYKVSDSSYNTCIAIDDKNLQEITGGITKMAITEDFTCEGKVYFIDSSYNQLGYITHPDGGGLGLVGNSTLYIGVGSASSWQNNFICTSDNTVAYGTFTNSSDLIYKSNVVEYDESVIDILMNTKVYKYLKSGEKEIGLLAQDLKETAPDLLHGTPSDTTIEEANSMSEEERKQKIEELQGNDGSVNIYSMVSTLWKVCQEQQQEIEKLKVRENR